MNPRASRRLLESMDARRDRSPMPSPSERNTVRGRCRATNVPEQGRVVHVRSGPIVQAAPTRESGCDEATSHRRFGRVAHTQITDERQRRQQFGAS